MPSTPKILRRAAALLALPLLPAALEAQHALLAEDHGAMSLVVGARGNEPCVMRDGKVVQIATKGYKMVDVPEYLPVFVALRDVDAHSSSENYNATGDQLNNSFNFHAILQTAYPLSDVFLVLSLETQAAGKVIFLTEIGQLDANADRPVSIYVPLKSPLGNGLYIVNLFSGGSEVFHSKIPFWTRDAALNKMIAKRIDGVTASPPRFFIGPAPEYPPELRRQNVNGRAVISVKINGSGSVLDPVVKSATDPAFGLAALEAIKDWRFIPKVKDGYPVESRADVPFIFSPPRPAPGS